MTVGKREKNQAKAEIKTFPVSFLEKSETGNVFISTEVSKEQIINQAIHFHLKGNIPEALKCYQNCINQGFKDYRVFANYAIILRDLGKFQDAEISINKAIELKPDFADSHNNLGNILKDLGKLQDAEFSYRKAIEINPKFADAYSNLGNILKDLGKLQEAKLSYQKAIEFKPNFAEAYSNMGIILKDLGRLQDAEFSYRKAIEINPKFADVYSNLGNILKDLGKLQEAKLSYQKAIELKPDFAKAHYNLGNILKELGKSKEAEEFTRKAIELKPDFADAYNNLGGILIDLGKLKDASIEYIKAIKIKPDSSSFHYNLGTALKEYGNFAEAINHFKQAIKLNSKLSIAKAAIIETKGLICDWSDQDIQNTWLKTIGIEGSSVSPVGLLSCEDNPKSQFKRAINFYQENYSRETKKIISSKKNKINIGYFSADFRSHPMMKVMARVFELHNKEKFNIFAYSFTNKQDHYTERLKKSVYCFRDITGKDHIESVNLARKDDLDIAIDLMGYTKNNRMEIFSYRVAPIQIHYLCNTTGSTEMDYFIADKTVVPEELKKYYSEKIIYKPNCFMCYDNNRKISQKKFIRKDFNLPKDAFIMAAFHNNYKITIKEINSWARILRKAKNSIIWISDTNSIAKENIYKAFKERLVNSEQIHFARRMNTSEEHLSRHSCADIFVDTFNFNAASTAIDSLWSGLPIVTLLGRSFTARTCSSFLKTLDLDSLIASTIDEYENKILELANNPHLLTQLKQNLKNLKKTNPLFDSKKSTQDLENIYINVLKDKL